MSGETGEWAEGWIPDEYLDKPDFDFETGVTLVDTEEIDAFITRMRIGIDSLVDKLTEELEEVAELITNGDYETARLKVQGMIRSIEESDEDSD